MPNRVEEHPFRIRDGTHYISQAHMFLILIPVLEALNRLLDDNRELVIPENGEVIRPHPHFMLFATQNPQALYVWEEGPVAHAAHGKKVVAVFGELQKRRQSGGVFESKQGFAAHTSGFVPLYQEEIDKVALKEAIESTMDVRIDEHALYDFESWEADLAQFHCRVPSDSSLIWTKAMRHLFVLLTRALRFNEPVLLVGETGSGKISACQVFAATISRNHVAFT
ncbi:hypothetical protein BT96DRAFT_1006606 [Gymnopus androsaceus JB14]|uniref:ATPase dynein-related AAA domain-containing protein n=1 Tax=Gymnopus androsaceus JB14 TaxID=1447944 RepID=A0A6A4GKU6_9AGAR|nr:hypothetical protein BT96DRAFT_1006606 [Gymnopus androsaceus JB14]